MQTVTVFASGQATGRARVIAFSIDNSFSEVKGLAVTHVSILPLALPRNIKVSMSDGVSHEIGTERCRACGARMRSGDAWCGQCHTARLTMAPTHSPEPGDVPDVLAMPDVLAVHDVAVPDVLAVPDAPAVPDALVASWLAELAAEHPPLLRGRWAGLGERNTQILLAGGGGLLMVGLALLAMVLVGHLV